MKPWMSLLLVPALTATASPDVPEPTCASCGVQGYNRHASDCPYASRGASGGDGGARGEYDPAHAPIFTVPIGMAAGVFVGAGWFCEEAAGNYPDTSWLRSYSDYMTSRGPDEVFNKQISAGMHIGGAPWLLVYIPGYPLCRGVAALAGAVTPSPESSAKAAAEEKAALAKARAAAYAARYAELERITTEATRRARAELDARESARLAFLDGIVQDHAELRELRDSGRRDLARSKAEAMLAVWERQRAERGKLRVDVVANMRATDELLRRADKQADDSASGFFKDMAAPPWLETPKTVYDIAQSVKDLDSERRKAAGEGCGFVEWLARRETKESTRRLSALLLSSTEPAAAAAKPISGVTALADIGYATVARMKLSGEYEANLRRLESLASAGMFHDVQADDYFLLKVRREAARREVARLEAQRSDYESLRRSYESRSH